MRHSQVDKRAYKQLTIQSLSDYEIEPGVNVNTKTDTYERVQAQVKFFSIERGYGFIKRPNKPDIFFTVKQLEKIGLKSINENDLLEFDLVPVAGKGGKAINLKKV